MRKHSFMVILIIFLFNPLYVNKAYSEDVYSEDFEDYYAEEDSPGCCNVTTRLYNSLTERDARPRFIKELATGVTVSISDWFAKYEPKIDTSELGFSLGAISTEVSDTSSDKKKISGPGTKTGIFGNIPIILYPSFVVSTEFNAAYSSPSLNGKTSDQTEVEIGPKLFYNLHGNFNVTTAALFTYTHLSVSDTRLEVSGFSLKPGISYVTDRISFGAELYLFKKTGIFVSLTGKLF